MSDWHRIEAVFDAARRVPKVERAALVDHACAGDSVLANEVYSLLEAIDTAPTFDSPPLAPMPLGPTLGPYEIQRVLGEGGAGVVYEALQKEPRRRVALKVLRFGLASGTARARFAEEARILANLSHPAIAALYDAGTHAAPDGRPVPYLSMELVADARPVTTHVREASLGARAALQLFLQVAEGVMAGHQRGIIHRDLKPDNVLVDGAGRPKIVDFGIARVTAPDLARTHGVTGTGAVIGTLGYIAPEQLSGSATGDDVRIDVYALGVMLYEMLTRKQPIELRGLDVAASIRAILETPPTPAARHVAHLPRDLGLILGKALQKQPELRYASVQAFADDVRAFLAHEPIQARAPSWTYQCRLFATRHRPGVLAAAVTVAALGAAMWMSLSAAREQERQRRIAEREAERARGMSLGSQAVLHGMLVDYYEDLAALPASLIARRALVERVEQGMAGIMPHAGEDARLLRMGAALQLKLGRLNYSRGSAHVGRPVEAARCYERARALYRVLMTRSGEAPADRSQDAAEHAAATIGLAEVLHTQGRLDEALARFEQAHAELAGLVETDPADFDTMVRLAGQRLRVARLLDTAGRSAQSMELLETALSELVMPPSGHASGPAALSARGHVAALLGELRLLAGKTTAARRPLERATADFEAYSRVAPERGKAWQQLATIHTHWGDFHLQQDDTQAARVDFEQALRFDEQALALEPADRGLRQAVQVDHAKLAQVYEAGGDTTRAIAAQRKAAALARTEADERPDHLDTQLRLRMTLNHLGGMLCRAGASVDGGAVLEEAHGLAQRILSRHGQHPEARLAWAEALDGLGIARYFAALQPDAEALTLLGQALQLFLGSKSEHASLARDGLLPATHAEAEARIDNKIQLMRTEIAKRHTGK